MNQRVVFDQMHDAIADLLQYFGASLEQVPRISVQDMHLAYPEGGLKCLAYIREVVRGRAAVAEHDHGNLGVGPPDCFETQKKKFLAFVGGNQNCFVHTYRHFSKSKNEKV